MLSCMKLLQHEFNKFCFSHWMHTYKQSSLTPDLASLFMLPLSQQAYDKLQNLQRQLLMVPFDTQAIDQWSFIWGNQTYTSSKLYNLSFVNVQVPDTHRWIWKSKYVPRIKLFASLMFVDRLNTRTMLKRSNSTSIKEDIDHLFFACPFATRCWNTLNIQWDLHFNLGGF